jgi:hypothetical protein
VMGRELVRMLSPAPPYTPVANAYGQASGDLR